jgi:hypothetical protein
MKKYSFGKTDEEAIRRAEKIQYSVYSKDSVLDLANGYAIDKDSKFRGQQVEIEILVPVGKKIRFDESVNDKLNPTSFKIRRRYSRSRNGVVDIRVKEDVFMNRFRSDVDYVMGIDGMLRDAAGNSVINNDYRYDNQKDTNNTIEEQRKKVEEEQRKLKQLEEHEIKKKNTGTGKSETMEDEDGDITGSPSSVFSLVTMFN